MLGKNKNKMRKSILQARKNLTSEFQKAASSVICKHLSNLAPYINSQQVAVYVAINNEVDLQSLWQNSLKYKTKFFFPKLQANNQMVFLPANSKTKFINNKWGISEPSVALEKQINPSNLDAVIMPVVAFDILGNRLGMGGGYYDRALQNVTKPKLIGVAYEFQKQPIINSETWDIKLDIIVTEDKIYYT